MKFLIVLLIVVVVAIVVIRLRKQFSREIDRAKDIRRSKREDL
jgi:flagellar biogenesis protein FliO